jgi:Secretion system C-terminal sorting domain
MKKIITIIYALVLLNFFIPNPMYAQFTQQGNKLVGTGAVNNSPYGAHQGSSVSISSDGNTAIVGGSGDNNAKGAVWFYTRIGGVWSQQGTKLVGTGAIGTYGPYQGGSVSISSDGNTAIAGGMGDNSFAGAAWIFSRTNGVWHQQGSKLVGSGAVFGLSEQGESVSISGDGNTAIVGGSGDSSGIGAVWVYTRTAGVWTQQGNKLIGTGAFNPAQQGRSVYLSYDGNTAIVGGPNDNDELNVKDIATGAAWVFTRSGGVWTQQGSKLVGSGTGTAGSLQGTSVSISSDGNTAIVGGWKDNGGTGAAWVFTRSGTVWTQQGSKLTGTGATALDTRQGWSVSISSGGNTAIVGGWKDNNNIGAAWIFTRTGGQWTQQGSKLVGTGAVGSADQATSVSISSDGSTAIVGGIADNSNAGAVWVYHTGNALPRIAQTNQDLKTITGLMLYPNPANDNLTVEFTGSSEGNVKVNVYSMLGKNVMSIMNPSVTGLNTFSLNTSNLVSGFYIFEMTNNGLIQRQKFLVSR